MPWEMRCWGRRLADAADDELVRDLGRQRVAEVQADEVQDHVHGGGSARAGEAVAVHLEDVACDRDEREALGEPLQVPPVHGRSVSVQHPRFGQVKASGPQSAEMSPLARVAAQPRLDAPMDPDDRLELDAADDVGEVSRVLQRPVGHDGHPVDGFHRPAIERDEVPLEQVPAPQPVGHAKRIDGVDERNDGESAGEVEPDADRLCLVGSLEHHVPVMPFPRSLSSRRASPHFSPSCERGRGDDCFRKANASQGAQAYLTVRRAPWPRSTQRKQSDPRPQP